LIGRWHAYVRPSRRETAGINQEEFMRYLNATIGVAMLCAGVAASVLPASADEPANVSGCLALQEQVKVALTSKAQSANYEQAATERRLGLEQCNGGFYKSGIAHYDRALALLSGSGT
jgi:glycogen synthase